MIKNKKNLLEYYETGPGIISSTYPNGEESSIDYKIDSIVGWHRIIKEYVDKFDFNGTILDLGCGTGHWSKVMSENGDVVSCDLSMRALKMARNNGKSIGYVKCDVEKLPFKKKSFDSLISIAVLEHIPDDKAVMKEVSRILKDNGICMFNVPNKKPFFLGKTFWLIKLKKMKTSWDRSEGHLREYDKKRIRILSSESNMRIVNISYSWILFAPGASIFTSLMRNLVEKENIFSRISISLLKKMQDLDRLIEKFPRSTNINFVLKKN